jgi:hypothetical protein
MLLFALLLGSVMSGAGAVFAADGEPASQASLAVRAGHEVGQTFSDSMRDAARVTGDLRLGPAAATQRNRTSFDEALRCMDRLFSTYGIHNVPMILEHIPDATTKVSAGAREMFMSATSRMTLRSHAIRLVPVTGSVLFLERRDFIDPQGYALQGSISQLDDSIVKRQRDGSICIGPFCIGLASSDSYSALGLDLNVIRASDLSMIPGVTSKNAVLIARHGAGSDGEFSTGKFGLNFNFSFSTSEGNGQALRTMVELGAIELYGRLARVPYWSCLGTDDRQDEVAGEIDDWWESFAADQPQLWRWLQTQMTARGLYRGPVDGVPGPDLVAAVSAYQEALGLTAGDALDVRFLRAYLAADHVTLEPQARAKLHAAAPTGAEPPVVRRDDRSGTLSGKGRMPDRRSPADSGARADSDSPARPSVHPATLEVREAQGGKRWHARGEPYALEVQTPTDGYLYCWLVDDRQRVAQFFPNPSVRNAHVSAAEVQAFPGDYGFSLLASARGKRESVACGLSSRDLGYAPLAKRMHSVHSINDLRMAFQHFALPRSRFGVLDVDAR